MTTVRREFAIIGVYLEMGARTLDLETGGTSVVLSVKLKDPDKNTGKCVDLKLLLPERDVSIIDDFIDTLQRELTLLQEKTGNVERMPPGAGRGELPS